MTFGIGSPGFDPFACPDIPEGEVWNVMCFDPIDGPLFVLAMFAVFGTVGYLINRRVNDGEE